MSKMRVLGQKTTGGGAPNAPPPSLFRVKGIHELNECQILIVHLLEIRGVTQQGLHVNDEIK